MAKNTLKIDRPKIHIDSLYPSHNSYIIKMSTTESFSDILDLGREKMSEGDYLKLASFLGTLHNSKKGEVIEKIYHPNIVLEFDTSKDKHYIIKINIIKLVKYTNNKKKEYLIIGTVNDKPFENNKDDFIKQWKARFSFYGIKNIKRNLDSFEIEEFKTIGRWRSCLDKKDISDRCSDTDDEEQYESYTEHTELFYVNRLFGIDDIIHLTM